MRTVHTVVLVLGVFICLGCGNKPTNDFDITKDANYHANPDPRSYTGLYDGTNLDPEESSGKAGKEARK